eukprot:278858-Prorocentrum_minimum.AAC.5
MGLRVRNIGYERAGGDMPSRLPAINVERTTMSSSHISILQYPVSIAETGTMFGQTTGSKFVWFYHRPPHHLVGVRVQHLCSPPSAYHSLSSLSGYERVESIENILEYSRIFYPSRVTSVK